MDPWLPVDYAVISHGHADHARWGMKHYLCHHLTKPILKLRIGNDINVESLNYNQPIRVNGVKVSFHPAGHIIGSCQIRLEYNGFIVVFTGDYKTTNDGLTMPFESIKCHEFITESTFGLPIYKWQPDGELKQRMHEWIATNQSQNRTSVFFGYSLGKAQRIIKMLEGITDIYAHSAIYNLNEAMLGCGVKLPQAKLLHSNINKVELQNKIVVLPPALLGSTLLKRIPNAATAVCSGWMQIRGNKRWRAVDAGFAVSDHADWNGLLQAVEASGAEKIYVTHGTQAIFAKYLNSIGFNAKEVKTAYGDEQTEDEDAKSVST